MLGNVNKQVHVTPSAADSWCKSLEQFESIV